METMDSTPPPRGFGWTLNSGELYIDWSDENAAPDEVLEFLCCSCKNACLEENDCGCASNSLKCTDICSCKNCKNIDEEEEIAVDENEGDLDEMDEDEDEEGHNCVEGNVNFDENICARCNGRYGPGTGYWSQCKYCLCWYHDDCY